MAAEILTFIEFPEAGYYTMIFNSDDGFLVLKRMELATAVDLPWASSMAAVVHRTQPLVLRLQSQVSTPFVPFGTKVAVVPTWSGQALWMVVVLINDTSAGGLKAYRSRTGTPTNVDTGGGDNGIGS